MALTRTRASARWLTTLVAGLALAVMTFGVLQGSASAAPGDPPTSASVQAQLDQLERSKEALAEKYNLAQIDVAAKQKAAAAAKTAADQAQAGFLAARGQFRQLVATRYETASFSSTGALFSSDSRENYLTKMSQLSLLTSHRGDIVAQISAAKSLADAAQGQAAAALKQSDAALADVVKQRNDVLAQTKKFTDLLATVTAQERAAYAAAHTAPAAQAQAAVAATQPPAAKQPPSTVVAGKMTAQQKRIVDFVVSKVGGCYTFAGVGNPCYDCSGLAMMAYQQVGISLPHNAATQYNYGRHVSSSDLQPGDLVFLYQPIGHVEIYIGNGVAVSAADEELGIRYVNVFSDMADYTGATRLL